MLRQRTRADPSPEGGQEGHLSGESPTKTSGRPVAMEINSKSPLARTALQGQAPDQQN